MTQYDKLLPQFGYGAAESALGLVNMMRPGTFRPGINVFGDVPQPGHPNQPAPEPEDSMGRIMRGAGNAAPYVGLLGPMGAAGGGSALASMGLNMLGATAGETAREYGAGGLGQYAADVGLSMVPGMAASRIASSKLPQMGRDLIEEAGHRGTNAARYMQGLSDQSTDRATRMQRMGRERGTGTGEDLRQLVMRTGGVAQPNPGSDAFEPSTFIRRAPGKDTQSALFGDNVIATYDLPKDVKEQFASLGVATPRMLEIDDAAQFHRLISEAKDTTPFGAAVYVYPEKEYRGFRMFVTEDGKAGLALKPDGDTVSGFSASGNPNKGLMPYMKALGLAEGGTTLDAFNVRGGLPRIYGDSGYDTKPGAAGIDEWNPQYKPDDWDENFLGKPNVVYMQRGKSVPNTPTPNYGVNAAVPAGVGARVIQEQRGGDGYVSGLPPLLTPF